MRIKVEELDPKLREAISSVTSLNSDKTYLLEISKNISVERLTHLAQNLHDQFKSLGLNCIVTVEGMISNIYELKGGDNSDTRAGIE